MFGFAQCFNVKKMLKMNYGNMVEFYFLNGNTDGMFRIMCMAY